MTAARATEMVVEVSTEKNDAVDSKHEEEEQTEQQAEKRDQQEIWLHDDC